MWHKKAGSFLPWIAPQFEEILLLSEQHPHHHNHVAGVYLYATPPILFGVIINARGIFRPLFHIFNARFYNPAWRIQPSSYPQSAHPSYFSQSMFICALASCDKKVSSVCRRVLKRFTWNMHIKRSAMENKLRNRPPRFTLVNCPIGWRRYVPCSIWYIYIYNIRSHYTVRDWVSIFPAYYWPSVWCAMC